MAFRPQVGQTAPGNRNAELSFSGSQTEFGNQKKSQQGRPFRIPILLLVLLLSGCGPSPQQTNNRGNQAYERQDYGRALADYQQAGSKLPQAGEPAYNAGNTLYRQGDFDGSQGHLQQALQLAGGDLSQQGYYNLGNTLFQAQQYGPAAEAYKEALRLEPRDMDAKHNLELALQKQKQEQEQQPSSDDQGQQEQPSSDDQGQPTPQPNDQGQPTPQPGDEGQAQQPGATPAPPAEAAGQAGEDESDSQGQEQTQPGQQLTQEQARQLLAAAAANAQSLQEYLQQVFVAPESPPEQDW